MNYKLSTVWVVKESVAHEDTEVKSIHRNEYSARERVDALCVRHRYNGKWERRETNGTYIRTNEDVALIAKEMELQE